MLNNMEYDVLEMMDIEIFKVTVNDAISNGWELVGGICYDPGRHVYMQAVIKRNSL